LWKKTLDFLKTAYEKRGELFTYETVKVLFIHNYQAVLIFAGLLSLLIFIITISFAFARRGRESGSEEVVRDEVYFMKKQIERYPLLLEEELEFPPVRSFTIKNGYIEFMPGRQYIVPEIDTGDFDGFFSDILQEDCLLPVEKRRKGKSGGKE
jgi:hypothetical protein